MQDKVYRCGKQCRQHWNSFLNPQKRKGNWKEEEDYLLVQLIHNENGDKKWSKIIHKFRDRTENALKNRFTNLIQKQRVLSGISKKKVSQTFLRQMYLERNKEKGKLFDPQLKKYQNQPQRQKDFDADNDEKIRNYKTRDEISSAFNITDVNTVTLNSVDQICGIGNLWFARQEKNKIYLENKAHILKNTSNDQKYQQEIK